ncbi:hypothetical protein DFH28DRAFT_849415, partial [Melampsora americana]
RTIRICRFINEVGMSPKSFIQNLLDSDDPQVVKRRQFFGTATGWPSTQKMIESIKTQVFKNRKKMNSDNWSAVISGEAKEIVNRENLPRGHAPNGSFYSADRVDYSFFKPESEAARDDSLRKSMPFLHAILYSKIDNAISTRN